jgi:hypothetical protein
MAIKCGYQLVAAAMRSPAIYAVRVNDVVSA